MNDLLERAQRAEVQAATARLERDALAAIVAEKQAIIGKADAIIERVMDERDAARAREKALADALRDRQGDHRLVYPGCQCHECLALAAHDEARP